MREPCKAGVAPVPDRVAAPAITRHSFPRVFPRIYNFLLVPDFLFRNRLQCVPSRYYIRIRLENARRLLRQTSMLAVDIAVACGFVSAPHFSRCYRKVFGVPPSEDRRQASFMN